MLLLFGCATGRVYKTDRFEVRIAEGTRVAERRGAGRTDWSFADEGGRQFLGASVYPVAGDPTIPCGIRLTEHRGAPAFLVRRTLQDRRIDQPVIASLLFPQDDGTVLDFTYLEREERARAIVASATVKRSLLDRPFRCESLRTGRSLDGEIYDAGLFSVRILPGTWLLDGGHFRSDNSNGGFWSFEEAATGKQFLTGLTYTTDFDDGCPEGRRIQINGATAFRSSDTDNLEPYAGPSNVRVVFKNRPPGGGYYLLEFDYDEHSDTARLAEKALESIRIREPTALGPHCERTR